MSGDRAVGRGLPIDWAEPSWAARRRLFRREASSLSFANFVSRFAEAFGPRTAFVLDDPIDYPGFSGQVVSYRDVERLVSAMAHALRELGVERGDRVGLVTLNRIEMSFMMFAAGRIGAIPVPMNFMLRPAEIETILQRSGAGVLVFDRGVYDGMLGGLEAVPSARARAMIGGEEPPPDAVAIRDLMASAPERIEPVEPSRRTDTAFLFFTSGTTGFPKGAMISHEAALVGATWTAAKVALMPKLPRNLVLQVMPVAHAGGYAGLLIGMATGYPAYFLSRFDPKRIVELIERHGVSVMTGTPAMYRILLEHGLRDADLSTIRYWGGGADAFSDDLVRTMRSVAARRGPLGIPRKPLFFRGYGMAEANSHVAQVPPVPMGDNCIGRILPPVRYRIVDEEGRDVRGREPGELWLAGPTITRGYWNDEEATRASFQGEWFRTGDVVRRGKWGMLFFVDRSNDIIKSGGYKIAAAEVEQSLMQHPDVEHAAVVGVADERKGQMPVAAVRLRPGASAAPEDILAWARERVAPYKCPRRIVVMPDMPFTFSLKPKRGEVRERIEKQLSAESPS